MADDGDGATDPDDASESDDSGVDDDGADDGVDAGRAAEILGFSRWWQIVAAAGMMAAVSPYQYVWSSIEQPLAEPRPRPAGARRGVFLYVVFQSLSQFPAGKWRGSRGPGALTFLAALLAGGGYVGLAYATTLWQLYLLYSLGAIGVGIVYTVAVNTAVKWFPDRTGLTTGVGTMAFAGGSALVVPYVRANATAAAYGDVLRNVGVAILVVTLVGAYLLRDPPDDWLGLEEDGDGAEGGDRSDNLAASLRGRAYTTREMLSTWQFWLLYAMFVAMAGADLIVIANVVRFAEQFGLAAVVATASATLLPVAAGVSRMILGEASDRFDRKKGDGRLVRARRCVPARAYRRRASGGRGRVRRAGDGGDVLLLAAVRLLPVGDRRLLRLAKLLRQLRGPLHREGRRRVFAGTVTGYLVATAGWIPTFARAGAGWRSPRGWRRSCPTAERVGA